MLGRTVRAVRQNAVAWLALFVALTGTSIAATHYVITSTKQIKPSVLKALRGSTARQGPEGPVGKTGLRGETGVTGDRGPQGPEGNVGQKGEPGAKGEAGSAIAYAHVGPEGALTESKGFEGADVEKAAGKEGEGVYCVKGLAFTPHNVVVTSDASATEEPAGAIASLGQSRHAKAKSLCAGAQITVETWERVKVGGELELLDDPFFISIN